jgi:hypothetical protein
MAGKKGSRWRHRGISRAATELGVEKSHLWKCLTGRRHSRRLMVRYAEWQQSAGGQAGEQGAA